MFARYAEYDYYITHIKIISIEWKFARYAEYDYYITSLGVEMV